MSAVFPYRYDIVGSFLRPNYLKEARADFASGKIDAAALEKVEDKAITELVAKEEQNGLKAVTDGEFRRAFWHLDFLCGLKGIKEVETDRFSIAFKANQPKAKTLKIVDKIDFDENHPFLKHFKFLKSVTKNAVPKQTIPSPAMLHLICCVRATDYNPIDLYKNEQDLFEDIAKAYQKAVKYFYDAGCRYLQFDDTSWGEFCSLEKRAAYQVRGINVDETAKKYVSLLNKILDSKPKDMTITIHICRGNFRSTWFSSGGYEPVADILFSNLKTDGFFLEYDSDRAGGFEPLRFIKDQKVVLGLITSKLPQLEKVDDVIARINEAAKYVKKEQLCVSPQCGFASTEEGNLLTEDEQWAKIRLVEEVAKKAFQ